MSIMWTAYIFKSKNYKWFYVGSTNNLEKRIAEHNRGRVESTRIKKPLTLVYRIDFATEKEARAYEMKIKQKRRLKEEIIRNL